MGEPQKQTLTIQMKNKQEIYKKEKKNRNNKPRIKQYNI